MLGCILHLIYSSFFTNALAAILSSVSLLLSHLFGEANFKNFKLNGPFQVGFKEFRTEKHDNMVSVFYPIDKLQYDKQIKEKNVKWLRNGDKTLMGLARAGGGNAYGSKGHMPLGIIRFFKNIYMDVVHNGDIASNLKQKALIPIIMSHGLSSNRTMHSGTCKDLASHGYVVFIMDHKDGTSSYWESSDGKINSYYDNSVTLYDEKSRRKQISIRVSEITSLIDELYVDSGNEILKRIGFGDSFTFDLDRLVMAGHSFGGMTAV